MVVANAIPLLWFWDYWRKPMIAVVALVLFLVLIVALIAVVKLAENHSLFWVVLPAVFPFVIVLKAKPFNEGEQPAENTSQL